MAPPPGERAAPRLRRSLRLRAIYINGACGPYSAVRGPRENPGSAAVLEPRETRDQLRPRMHPELAVDTREGPLDRLRAQLEPLRDLLVRVPAGHEGDEALLGGRQALREIK